MVIKMYQSYTYAHLGCSGWTLGLFVVKIVNTVDPVYLKVQKARILTLRKQSFE